MQEKEISPQESLDLINNMIGRARKRYSDNSYYFLLWGWLVIAACTAHYVFAVYEVIPSPSMAWLLMFVGAIISFVHGRNQGKRSSVTHYADKLYGWLWLSLGIGMVIIIINGQFVNYQIVPLILMLAGVGTFISGSMMRFKVLQFGAVCLWTMSIFAFQLNEVEQLPAMAAGIALGYLLPGYIMKMNYKKQRGV
jgi:hypothetical protein